MAKSLEHMLHDYLDSLEDLQLDAAAELVAVLEGLVAGEAVTLAGRTIQIADQQSLDRWLLSLSTTDAMDSLAQLLAVHLAPRLLPAAESIAVDAATRIVSRGRIAREVQRLAREVATESRAVLSPDARTRQAAILSQSLRRTLTGVQGRVQAVLDDAQARGGGPSAARRIIEQLRSDLTDRGPIFGPLFSTQTYRGDLRAATGQTADQALAVATTNPAAAGSRDATPPPNLPLRWIAALTNTCAWCLSRHGQVDTLANWTARGLPQTRWGAPCEAHCMCRLVPAFAQGEDGTIPGYAEITEDLRETAAALAATPALIRSADGEVKGLTHRVPAELLEAEAKGRDVRIDATRGTVAERRRDRILSAAAKDISVRRALRTLGQINAGGAS